MKTQQRIDTGPTPTVQPPPPRSGPGTQTERLAAELADLAIGGEAKTSTPADLGVKFQQFELAYWRAAAVRLAGLAVERRH